MKVNQNALVTDDAGKLLVSRQALLATGVYTPAAYRSGKSRHRICEVITGGNRYALLESLPEQTRRMLVERLTKISDEYTRTLLAASAPGDDCVTAAVTHTADLLDINRPFIRSAVETYVNVHHVEYIPAYMSAGLSVNSLKGYAKQCALVQWIFDFSQKITLSEPSAKRAALLMRSFRANLLTALSSINLEIKIPLSETRFNQWVDDILSQMQSGKRPEDIVRIKRRENQNSLKVTSEQFTVAYGLYISGNNEGVASVYQKWLEKGKSDGWWVNPHTGEFEPPTEGRLYQLLVPHKNASTLERTDAVTYQKLMMPAVTRDLPEEKNRVWIIDGTAHNEYVEYHGRISQAVYTVRVIDAATMRLVGACSMAGKETFDAAREAVLMGIRTTGYKPAVLQGDHGPAWSKIEEWCNKNDIHPYASGVGNARAKGAIESHFNMFDNAITRYRNGFSGGNIKATAIRSRSSQKREDAGKRNARSASLVIEWIRTEGITMWNEHIIETLDRKPCGKTPYELWAEKKSATPPLPYEQLCVLCGTRHDRKLTVNGLEISHKTAGYIYYPATGDSEQREAGARVYNAIPLLEARTAGILSIYILEPGEPAPVYDRSGQYLGTWELKKHVGYIDETGELGNQLAFANRVKAQATEFNQKVKDEIARRPDAEQIEALSSEPVKSRFRKYEGFDEAAEAWAVAEDAKKTKPQKPPGRYDKDALLAEETAEKGVLELLASTPEYKEYVDPDTGEVHRLTITD
jgi:hypothetical protein